MFRLEKIFQKDDNLYINISIYLKSFFVFISIYIFSILEFYSIYDLLNFDIYKKSNYFLISIYFSIFYFLFSIIFRVTKKRYVVHFFSFLFNDIVPFIIAIPFTLYVFFILKINFETSINNIYLLILIIINLFLIRKILDIYYNTLMNNNLIQRNVMLVGSIKSIQKILNEKKDKINIYKCCLIKSDDEKTLEKARMNLKIPVFTDKSEMRIILEYHELGQIWILDDEEDKNLVNYHLDLVVNFFIDIVIVSLKSNLKASSKLLYDNLINNNYTYTNYQTSQFYGLNLVIKLFLDKILSLIFIVILSPLFLLFIILIYIEDGFPIFFSQESAGWDGRRFNVYKLRIYKKKSSRFNEINNEEKKLLKIGKILRKLRIEEGPQLFNILKGDMSVVGPRPQFIKDDIIYSQVYKQFLKRNKTFPGLTGWAQINGYRGKRPSNENMKKRMEHDVWYMNNWSNWLDFYIILKTFFLILAKPKK